MILLEDMKRQQLIAKAKKGDFYSPETWGTYKQRRFDRRRKSKLASSVKQFNSINMNSLFKQDILDVNIDVRGETSNYTVRVSFNGILDELHNFLNGQNSAIARARDISKALTRAFNNNKVYVRCSCPD